MTESKLSPQQLLLPYLLFLAFASACFIYGGLILSGLLGAAVDSTESPIASLPFPLSAVFAVLAVSSVTGSFMVGRAIEPRRESDPRVFLQRLQIRLIVQAAFMESIAIFGLVGHLLGLEVLESLVWVGVGLLGLLTLFPGLHARMDELKARLRRDGGAISE